MARPPVTTVDNKVQIVLSVLTGEVSGAEAARRIGVSGQTISTWRKQFLDGGRAALAGDPPDTLHDVHALREEAEQLKAALGEACLEIRRLRLAARTEACSPTARRHSSRPR
jgi:transposase